MALWSCLLLVVLVRKRSELCSVKFNKSLCCLFDFTLRQIRSSQTEAANRKREQPVTFGLTVLVGVWVDQVNVFAVKTEAWFSQ